MKNPLSDKYQFYMLLETRSGLGENDVDKMNNFVANLIGTGVVTDGFVTDEPTKMKVSSFGPSASAPATQRKTILLL